MANFGAIGSGHHITVAGCAAARVVMRRYANMPYRRPTKKPPYSMT